MRHRIRNELLTHPYELPLAVCTAIIAVVFAISPGLLAHSPVSFETRGITHHAWHYSLLVGSVLYIAGRFTAGDQRAIGLQTVGLALLLGCLALNLTALVTAEFDDARDVPPLGGYAVAIRVALMVGIGLRLWILITRPTAEIPVGRSNDA